MTTLKPARKRRNGHATSRRIVEAAARIVREQGPQHVTTLRLAAASGIVQSGFYAHFRNVDEALVAAAEQAGQHVREVVRGGQAALLAQGGGSVAQLAEHYAQVLGALLRDRPFTELYLQERRSPSPLGQVLARFEADILADVAALLAQLVHPADPQPSALDGRQAERLVSLFWSALDVVLHGQGGEAGVSEAALHLAVLSKAGVELAYGPGASAALLGRRSLGLLDER